jgi:DNA-binding NarL/FixJ family response regulator
MSQTTTIFLVDDHPIILRSLRDILGSEKGLRIVGEAKSPAEARDTILAINPDVAIVDLNLEGGTGFDLIEELQTANPEIRVVVYSMRENIQTIADVYRSGAMAYVPKSGDPAEIVSAVISAARGRHYFVGDTAERLARFHATGNPDDPIFKLSSREFEIFRLAAEGLDNEQIAARLNIGVRSVSNRLVKIRTKLNVTNPLQFTRLALKYGHIEANSLLKDL